MLDYETLHKLLTHDPDIGNLLWKSRGKDMFRNEKLWLDWNEKNSNQPAITAICNGYRYGSILGKNHLAHRVIWLMENKEIPNIVDHINSNRIDNRIVNLRNVDITNNNRNLTMPSTNTSGVVGVSFYKSRNKWQAKIWNDNKVITLGRFDNFEDAVAARKKAEIEYGYHENHGKKNKIGVAEC